MAELTRAMVARLAAIEAREDGGMFSRVSGFAGAGADAIVFSENGPSFSLATESGAGLILALRGAAAVAGDGRVLEVDNPKYVFALCAAFLAGSRPGMIHPSAQVDEGARIGHGTSVGAASVIEAGARVGDRCEIGSRVTIHGCVSLGDGCVVQSGAVLGSVGFGYVRGPDGRYVRFPQIGTLRIENDVEIGANTTIDRGALGETSIGRGTKIDNLVHIGHNCQVGQNVVIAAQAGLSGSCMIEDGVMLGGQVGLGEKVTVGKGVILGGQGGLLPGKRLDGEGQVFWGTPARPVREYLRDVARMRRR